MLLTAPTSLYAAFDRFPTRKGASTHIAHFAPALFERAGGGLLYVLGGDGLPTRQIEDGVEIVRHETETENFLERAMAYGGQLSRLLDHAGDALSICHFRDPWGGVPILAREHRYATVYEVNALPSIELPHAFPGIAPRTLEKVHADERYCLEACDHVVTPSRTTRTLLLGLGVPEAKITVIPNGAEPLAPHPRPPGAPDRYLIYFGALQSWQGIDTLLRACARLADLEDLRLVVCGSARSRDARRCENLARKLGVHERTLWHWALSGDELAGWLCHAAVSVAPLRECARNVVQGCAPLKILESMAAGVAVVASDLPPVRELVTDGVEGRLVAPDRPDVLARTLRVLLAHPEACAAMGANGRARVEREFRWSHSLRLLHSVYDALVPARGAPDRPVATPPPALAATP